mmetsp:Transcript_7782/g.11543  ORF Transcript_7782/g.11543 Transcript_7782/m.11543 type:complete len:234 (+) Transcript_7782:30-731(+)
MSDFFNRNGKKLSHAFAGITTLYLIDGLAMNFVRLIRGEAISPSLKKKYEDTIPNSFLQFAVAALRKGIESKVSSSDVAKDLDPYSKRALTAFCMTPLTYVADVHLYKNKDSSFPRLNGTSFGYYAATEVICDYELLTVSSGNFFENRDRETFYKGLGSMFLLAAARIATAPYLQKSLHGVFGTSVVPRDKDVVKVQMAKAAGLEFLLRAATPSVYRMLVRAYGTIFGYKPLL